MLFYSIFFNIKEVFSNHDIDFFFFLSGMKCMSAHLYNLIDNLNLPECTRKYFESPGKTNFNDFPHFAVADTLFCKSQI